MQARPQLSPRLDPQLALSLSGSKPACPKASTTCTSAAASSAKTAALAINMNIIKQFVQWQQWQAQALPVTHCATYAPFGGTIVNSQLPFFVAPTHAIK